MDRQGVESWNAALQDFQCSEFESCVTHFEAIEGSPSCVLYNQAVVFQLLRRFEEAIQKLTEAIQRDPYFAIALFRRAYIFFLQEQYQNAIEDFESCSRAFRSAKHIDYTQHGIGGLPVTLVLSDVTFNTGISYFLNGNQIVGFKLLRQAQREADAGSRSAINEVLDSLQQSTENFDPQLISLPDAISLFKPLRRFSSESKDFLGTQREGLRKQ